MRDHIGNHMRSRRNPSLCEGDTFTLADTHICQNTPTALPQRDDTAPIGATVLTQPTVDTLRTPVHGAHVATNESTINLNRARQHQAFGLSPDGLTQFMKQHESRLVGDIDCTSELKR